MQDQANKKMQHKCCKVAFNQVEVHCDGKAYTCCPGWIKCTSIGNIYKERDFNNVWNSEIAKDLRTKLLKQDYSYCDFDFCPGISGVVEDKIKGIKYQNKLEAENTSFPTLVKFCHDYECNIACVTCRNSILRNNKESLEDLNSRIKDVYLPMLKNAEIACFAGNGDPFGSRHYAELIKGINIAYPKIRYDLHTNGLLCDKKNCERLGVLDKLHSVEISIHAATKETYDKICKYSDFEKVIKNLKWLSEMKKSGKIEDVYMIFVMSYMNYHEMPAFLILATELNINALFKYYRPWGSSALDKEYKKMAIFESDHPEHYKLVKILKNKIFNQENCFFGDNLAAIKEERINKLSIIKYYLSKLITKKEKK